MALALSLSVIERNDSKLITFTDTSTGWGTGGDPNVTDIAARTSQTYSLTMDITVNTTSSTLVCTQLDLYNLAGPFTTQSDLVFELDATNIVTSSGAYGDSNTQLPDGVWDITYKVQHYTGGNWVDVEVKTFSVLVYGVIKTKVYDKLRKVPKWSDCQTTYRDIQEAGYYFTYLKSIEKSAFIARKSELIQMLETLERLLLNGSNYPW